MTAKKGILHPFFKSVKRRNWELPTSQPHIHAQYDNGRHVEDREVIKDSHWGFTQGKSYVAKQVVFYDGLTASLDKEVLQTSSTWVSVRHLIWYFTTYFSLYWRNTGLVDGLLDG